MVVNFFFFGICAPDVANLLLDLPNGLKVSRAVKGVPAHEEELDQIPCDVAPGDVKPPREVRECKAVVYGHDVRHTIARVDHDAGRQACIVSVSSYIIQQQTRQGEKKTKKKRVAAHLAHRA